MASVAAIKIINDAMRGDPAAQLRLGRIYLTGGEGLARNPEWAYKWLSKAATNGVSKAYWHIGHQINPMEIRASAAREWYEYAARRGSGAAKKAIARLALEQPCHIANLQVAYNWLEDEALKRDPEATTLLAVVAGRLEAESLGAIATRARYVSLLRRAASLDDSTALRLLCDVLWQHGACNSDQWISANEFNTSLRLRSRTAQLIDCLHWHLTLLRSSPSTRIDQSIVDTVYRIGFLSFCLGNKDAVKWLEIASDAHHAEACWLLAVLYAGAKLAKHIRWNAFPFAEELECKSAMVDNTHFWNAWIPKNYQKARVLLSRASDLNLPDASFALYCLYGDARISFRDDTRAAFFLERAAVLDHGLSQLFLAKALLRKSAVKQALVWLFKAHHHGISEADALIKRHCSAPACLTEDAEKWLAMTSPTGKIRCNVNVMRLRLAVAFNLKRYEMLYMDPTQSDCGEFIWVDVRDFHRKSRPRAIRVLTDCQRLVLSEARTALAQNQPMPISSNYSTDRARIARELSRLGLDIRNPLFGSGS